MLQRQPQTSSDHMFHQVFLNDWKQGGYYPQKQSTNIVSALRSLFASVWKKALNWYQPSWDLVNHELGSLLHNPSGSQSADMFSQRPRGRRQQLWRPCVSSACYKTHGEQPAWVGNLFFFLFTLVPIICTERIGRCKTLLILKRICMNVFSVFILNSEARHRVCLRNVVNTYVVCIKCKWVDVQ